MDHVIKCLKCYEECLRDCIKDVEEELEHNPTQFDLGMRHGLYAALINFEAMEEDILNGKESSD